MRRRVKPCRGWAEACTRSTGKATEHEAAHRGSTCLVGWEVGLGEHLPKQRGPCSCGLACLPSSHPSPPAHFPFAEQDRGAPCRVLYSTQWVSPQVSVGHLLLRAGHRPRLGC